MKNPSKMKSHQMHRVCGFGGFRIDIWIATHTRVVTHVRVTGGASARREPPRNIDIIV